MNSYITGSAVKLLREGRGMTQAELAERSGVSGKEISRNAPAVSRTGILRGYFHQKNRGQAAFLSSVCLFLGKLWGSSIFRRQFFQL